MKSFGNTCNVIFTATGMPSYWFFVHINFHTHKSSFRKTAEFLSTPFLVRRYMPSSKTKSNAVFTIVWWLSVFFSNVNNSKPSVLSFWYNWPHGKDVFASIRDRIIKYYLLIVKSTYFSYNIAIYIKIFIRRNLLSEYDGYLAALWTDFL